MAHHKSADPNIFILPDLGEGVHEAELIKWRVAVGQKVNEHDILAEMETDKALVEVPSPRTGVIKELHGTEGEILHVGNPLVSYEGAGTAAPAAPTVVAAPKPAAPEPSSNGSAHAEPVEDAGTVVGQMSASAAGVSAAPGKALATPAVRRLARDLGLDIDTLTGTGIGGRVLEKDVRNAASGAKAAPAARTPTPAPAARPAPTFVASSAPRAAAPAPKPAPSFPAGQDTVRVPFRGVRRTIANRLRESVNRAVHFNVMDEADVSSLDSLRKKLGAASGEKLSFLPFVASAVARVLSRAEFRAMNATVEESDNKDADAFIIQHRAVHIGIATDTDSGLMVPVIRDCDALGVLEIGRQITAVAAAARSRTIPREQLMGSTFTISNVGSHAGRFATPIINYPEVAILAVGRARHAPVVRHGGLFVGNLLPLSLACDHRVVDGATAALALAEIVKLLQEHPDTLMGPARG
ncbi:MAG: 2-oxo acid dehydrogenase subunit E2 [Phycisphaerales bacterium]|jgi:pyruvate dehydrogenase E2 component (dihydrolipoamide acetyltransferase)|nr:2-oxo acid dehydrogenase subunit E2 [Phycisphaerales bacterium]